MKFFDRLVEFVRRYLCCGHVRVEYENVAIKTELPYELRKYPASKLVCTTLETTERSFEKNLERTERQFNRYGKGKNSFNMRVVLPEPLIIKVSMEENDDFVWLRKKDDTFYHLSYFIPKKYQTRDHPEPRAEQNLHFEDKRKTYFYVIKFRGIRNQEDWTKQLNKLKNYMKRDAIHFDTVDFKTLYYCRYSSPLKFLSCFRLHEVWIKMHSQYTDSPDSYSTTSNYSTYAS